MRTPQPPGESQLWPFPLRTVILTRVSSPHFGDQCFACSNDKTSSGFQIDNPTLLHCQCDPGTGAASYNWPTAVFDISTFMHSNTHMNIILWILDHVANQNYRHHCRKCQWQLAMLRKLGQRLLSGQHELPRMMADNGRYGTTWTAEWLRHSGWEW